jgi:hypothetical protein
VWEKLPAEGFILSAPVHGSVYKPKPVYHLVGSRPLLLRFRTAQKNHPNIYIAQLCDFTFEGKSNEKV